MANKFVFMRGARGYLVAVCLCASPAIADPAREALGVVSQAKGLPREFEAHFFDVPLAVRVDLDGRYLGDAMVVLGRDERVQLLEFTDTQDSRESASVRRRWQERLGEGRPLGDCSRDCIDGLRAIHYSLVNSQLSLLTNDAEQDRQAPRFHALPEQGSHGLLLRNQLNLVNDGQATSGRFGLQGQGSLGNWTALADAQFDRGSVSQHGTRHRMDQLYAERLHDQHFFRLGYFTPGAQGLTRQPRLLGSSPDTTLGLMFGSSDSLLIDNGQPSSTPIYVTPNRPGQVEFYRNGVLINSQPVQPGLQALDTRVLPGGIYQVEVRLIEDGQETSRTEEFIYKPSNWRNSDSRWRYNLFLGQQTSLLSNWDDAHDNSLGAGVMLNYLVHPRAIVGTSVQRVDEAMQYGTSLDWDLLDRLKLYGNLYRTEGQGDGYDLQMIHSHALGSLVLSHNQAWTDIDTTGNGKVDQQQEITQTALSFNHHVTSRSTATLRLAHSNGAASGLGVDLGWSYYGKLAGSDANWRLSLFDRPGTASSGGARNRGVNLSLSMSLGGPGRRIAASLGSRTSRDGGRDQNGSIAYQQDVELGPLRNLGASASVDRYGVGFGGNAQFQSQALFGDAFAQSSSYNDRISGGLNLQSVVAMGGGELAVSGQHLAHEAGLIIDVETDLPALEVRADDQQGLSATLRPGRNIVPVGAYRAGHVQFDFAGTHDPAAVIQPSSLDYHLNRGGVEYRKLKVLRTVTVLGRLVDHQGQPLSGAQVINHASRGISEVGGHFAVEMSEAQPNLEIRHGGKAICLLELELSRMVREGSLLLAGDLPCLGDNQLRAALARTGDKS
ncbi:TcfC E-set like domain-containing protein [Pseudomonas sichuanensis]|uniref:TcfC E-set like domain-containing protein n=1 Tax=Pseudomonas TaxID=286 RepID=UPI0036E12FE0